MEVEAATRADPPRRQTGPCAALPDWTPAAILHGLAERGEAAAVMELRGDAVVTVTRGALLARVHGAADAMTRAGLAKGDVVAIRARNSANWISAGLACGEIGAIMAPLDVAGPPAEVPSLLAEMAARAVWLDSDADDPVAGETAASGPAVLRLDTIAEVQRPSAPVPLDPDDPLVLFRTSGTTGTPKRFHLTCRNVGASVDSLTAWGGVGPGDRALMPLPMHHVYPWITATLGGLAMGAALVLPEGPTGPQIAAALRATRPTVLIGVPKLFEAMLDGIEARFRRGGRIVLALFRGLLGLSRWLTARLGRRFGALPMWPVRRAAAPDLRLMVSGGAYLKPETERRLNAFGWDVRTGYGLSETAAGIVTTFEAARPGSAGKPIPGAEVRIAAPNAQGVGEIGLRGPSVFAGYLANPEANAQAFDAEGFFRTGDLGYLDADGFLHVTGRLKEVIVLAGGDNLYPEDVEERYLADPRIAEIGVLERDGDLVAVVVPHLAEIAKAGIVEPRQAVKVALDGVARDLPSTWRVSGFALSRDPLPRTRLGKLRRFLLPEIYERGGTGQAGPRALTAEERRWIAEPPRAEVWAALAETRAAEDFDLSSSLPIDFGLDSFDWMTLSVAIQHRTGVTLDMEDVAGLSTVRDLLETVAARAADPAASRIDEDALLADGRRWVVPRGAVRMALARALWALNDALMWALFRLRVEGARHIPKDRPVVIAANHVSDLDPAALGAALPWHVRPRAHWAGDRVRVFGSWWQDAFCRIAGVFPVDERRPMVAVRLAAEVLARGDVQVWFPEGWRSPDGRLLNFQAGIGHVVAEARVDVVPAYIQGTLDAWPRGRRLPRRARVRVTFGAPVPARDLVAEAGADPRAAERAASALRERIGALARDMGDEVL